MLTVTVTPKQFRLLLHRMHIDRTGPCSISEVNYLSPRFWELRLGFNSEHDRDSFVLPSPREAVAFSRKHRPHILAHPPRLYVNRRRIAGEPLMEWLIVRPGVVVTVSFKQPHGVADGPALLVWGTSCRAIRGTCRVSSDRTMTCTFNRLDNLPPASLNPV